MAPPPAARQLAPYGLACMQCFKSKCKCVSRPGGDGCERCHRLKKQCHPSDSLRRSSAQRKHSSGARIADLEGKVDSLVRLLNLVAHSPESSAALHSAVRDDDALSSLEHQLAPEDQDWNSSTAASAAPRDDGAAASASGADASPMDLTSSSPSDPGPAADTVASSPLAPDPSSMQDSEACLFIFRDKMLPTFPFIHLAPDATVKQLQRDRPFLLRAIIAVASPSKQQKMLHGRELKRVLAQATLVQNQSSIDLLLGLLVFTAWSYDQVFNPSGALSRLMLMAISLACDLRLDKPLPPDEHMMKPMIDGSGSWGNDNNLSKLWLVSEEQRAVLACYTLSSMISIYFAQIDAMKWKPRMGESLRAIEANRECPADAAFAFQVRLQLLAQKAIHAKEQREFESGPVHSANLYVRTLQTELQQLGDSLPPVLQQRGTLMMHMRYIELCINDTARSSYPDPTAGTNLGSGDNSGNSEGNTSSSSNMLSYDHLDFSWRSVGAIKAWMDIFFSLSPSECADRWEMASRDIGERLPDDLFMRLAGMMRKFHTTAAAKLGSNTTLVDGSGEWVGGGGTDTQNDATALQDPTLLQPMGNDAFLESVFGEIGLGWSV